jgi:hypothetical protein
VLIVIAFFAYKRLYGKPEDAGLGVKVAQLPIIPESWPGDEPEDVETKAILISPLKSRTLVSEPIKNFPLSSDI